jgi:hypothetical protein
MGKIARLTEAGRYQAGVAYLALLIVIAAELAWEGRKSKYAEWQFVFVAVNPVYEPKF